MKEITQNALFILVGIVLGFGGGYLLSDIRTAGRIDELGKQLDQSRISEASLTTQNSSLAKLNSESTSKLTELGNLNQSTEKDIAGFGDTIADSLRIVRELKLYFSKTKNILDH